MNFPIFIFDLGLIVFTIITDQKNRLRVVKFTGKIRNELKPMKNLFSDSVNFSFLSYGRLCTQNSSKNWPHNKTTISRKLRNTKNRKLIFHLFQHISHLSSIYDRFLILFVEKYFIHLAIFFNGKPRPPSPRGCAPGPLHTFGLNPLSHWLASELG